MRIYDPRVGRFLSVDPITKEYPFYSPYQFSGNMPIAATDLDGKEAKVSFNYATVTKDRTAIEVSSSVSIKIQIINLSSVANEDIDLSNVALNLQSDLSNKLSGNSASIMSLPFIFKSKGNYVTSVETQKDAKDNKNYTVNYSTDVSVNVSVANDISKIDNNTWVFAIVDNVNNQKNMDVAGMADAKRGKVAIGEAKYFTGSKAYSEGRQLPLHEVLHLLGANDTYPPNKGLPGTQSNDNVMYFLSPDNKKSLTQDQKAQEIWPSTVGSVGELFKPKPYKQPTNPSSSTPTQQQLKTFINENGTASKLNNP